MSAYDHARRYLEVQQWSGPILDRIAALEAENARLREALTPSADTKAAYIGEFWFSIRVWDEKGDDRDQRVCVPWTAIKEIMAKIKARAALEAGNGP